MIKTFLALILMSHLGTTAWAAKTRVLVNAAVPSSLPPPLLFDQGVGGMTGIVPEYTQVILDLLGRKGTMTLLPRNRMRSYLIEGKVDFLCYTSRDWTEARNLLHWSNVLFIKRDVILGPAPMPKHFKDLKGKIIGTMLGYLYPKIDDLFENKTLIREDGPSEESNMKKLLNNHLSYVIADEVFLDFYKKQHPDVDSGHERMSLQEYPISCSVSKKGSVTVKDLNEALDKLKNSKKLDAIFSKYSATLH